MASFGKTLYRRSVTAVPPNLKSQILKSAIPDKVGSFGKIRSLSPALPFPSLSVKFRVSSVAPQMGSTDGFVSQISHKLEP
jgi:hypothetical protein